MPTNDEQYPYPVDYNDHFETPLVAFQHLDRFLQRVCDRPKPALYDPYYCQGRSARLWKELGYDKVMHEKRDFYKDVAEGTVPENWHVLVTSDQHKERCFDYCFDQLDRGKMFALLLLPTYVAAKHYFRQHLTKPTRTVVYLVPSHQPYHYDHPEATGHDTSPFESMWFIGLPSGHTTIPDLWNDPETQLYTSLQQLQDKGIVAAQNRPNPKQRRRRNKQATHPAAKETHRVPVVKAAKKPTKQSKYRDTQGVRTKKRF